MSITKAQLAAIAPNLKEPKLSLYTDAINGTLELYNISTPSQIAMFIAQIMHESAECRYTKELASGAEYDVGQKAINLGNTPEDDGDGERYKGRGLIQITGLANYKQMSKDLGVDFVTNPELLEGPEWATKSAGWFWNSRKLNVTAADNTEDAFKKVTKRINGGYNGLDDRMKYWARAKKQLGI